MAETLSLHFLQLTQRLIIARETEFSVIWLGKYPIRIRELNIFAPFGIKPIVAATSRACHPPNPKNP